MHGGPIEADLDRFYQIDLLDFWRGRLTPRKLLNRIDHLPPGAALWIAAGDNAAWTEEAHLIARVVDALHGANWQRAGSPGKAPSPITRPMDAGAEANRETREKARFERFLARQREREASEVTDDEDR